MLTKKAFKQRALALGATVCGVGSLNEFKNEIPQRDPKKILPNAKCIIEFGFSVPKGIYKALEGGAQSYTYTTLGVKYLDEEFAEIFLLKIGALIENEGYDACLQKSIPNLRIQGDKTTNPEVLNTYELIHAEAVEAGKPVPDVMIDFGKAAKACGIGQQGLSGKILNRQHSPFMRYCFIISDIPFEPDEILPEDIHICDNCQECVKACPGKAISKNGTRDPWQCAVYYNGANGTKNPFMPPDAFADLPDRTSIITGNKHLTPEQARKVLNEIYFCPPAQHAYQCSICGRACDTACYIHLEQNGLLKRKFKKPFRTREPWQFCADDFKTE